MSEKPFDHYLVFETLDFVMDEEFQDWMRHPTPDREAYWRAFVVAFPQKKEAVEAAWSLLQQIRVSNWQTLTPQHLQQRHHELLARLDALPDGDSDADAPPDGKSAGRVIRWPRRWWVQAAAGLIPGALAWGAYQYGWAETEYQTVYSQQQRVLLADQTLVTLGANSQLRVPGRWRFGRQREVWLKGEGYFEVAKQPNAAGGSLRNFFVHTRQLNVEVLGTRFNVNTRRGKTTVLLDEGRIRLSAASTPKAWLLLRPGQVAEVPATRARISVTPNTDPTRSAWREGQLVFRNASLADLRQRVQDVFGLTLVFEGEGWKEVEFTGELPVRDAPLAMQILAETFGANATLEPDRLRLRKANPEP